MIDEDATFEKFGYRSTDLKPRSGKKIVVVCDVCRKVRVIGKAHYRDLCLACANRKHYDDPEYRQKNAKRLRELHNDPEWGKKHAETMKKKNENPEYRQKNTKRMNELYNDPEFRRKQLEGAKKMRENPEWQRKHAEGRKKMRENPEWQLSIKKRTENQEWKLHIDEAAKRRSEDPEWLLNNAKQLKKLHADPEFGKKISAGHQCVSLDEWDGFAGDQIYCHKFDQTCRESNREKYSRKCFVCGILECENKTRNGKQQKLSVHHVDLNKNQGCDDHDWKLVPLCMSCHSKAHIEPMKARLQYLVQHKLAVNPKVPTSA